ncbi:Ribosomal RNA-processing protein 14 [Fusarium oxysporum f. sp. albedinis]|nr:Ribosomal RNA-processing protein 14 [Fusarium oxysporum f. sp. albedinis]
MVIFCTNRAVMRQLQTLIDYMPRSQYGLLKTRHMSHFELQAHYCIHCIVQHSLGGPLVQEQESEELPRRGPEEQEQEQEQEPE